jgi:outer membrane cobalamin receptor
MYRRYAVLSLIFYVAFSPPQGAAQRLASPRHTISGYMRDSAGMENLIGATVYNRSDRLGTSSNGYGFYSLTLPQGRVELAYSYVGYATQVRSFMLNRDTVIDVSMSGSLLLEEVVVTARRSDRIQDRTQMSVVSIPTAQVKAAPALLGEVDVLKVLQLMPGIQSGGEGSSGLYVRGGGPDQNLILLDGVPVYNASHLFGFFSVFNADAINNIELLKGGFPARHGGRISSVIDVSMKEGNMQQLHGEGSIGVVASRLTIEGPILKNSTSFIISGRRTYVDLLARPFIAASNATSNQNTLPGYYFYDVNAKVNHRISATDHVYLSVYAGDDKFYVKSEDKEDPSGMATTRSKNDMGLMWGNVTGAFRWNHVFTNQLFGNTTLTYSRYRMNIYMKQWQTYENEEQFFGMDYLSGIADWSGRMAFDYLPSPNHYIRFGGNLTYHTFNPGAIGFTEEIPLGNFGGKKTGAFEYSLYAEDDVRLSDRLKANVGLRWSAFSVRGEVYHAPQPRLSARYLLTDELSAKAAYSRMAQYVHLLTNSNLGMPTDLWVPTTDILRPQRSDQVAAGFACNFLETYELSLEAYYKTMNNVIEYKEGASVFDVHSQWEDKVLQGEGRSYGVELFAQKKTGTLTGWIGYTLAWSDRRFDALNSGRRFSYKYDRRHDVSVVLMKKFGKRVELSGTWVFGSGSCITIPVSIFDATDPIYATQEDVTAYSERNGYRMAPYHRLDLSLSLIKKKRLYERRWIFGVFNAYNRRNPYFISLVKDLGYVDSASNFSDVSTGEQTRYRYLQVSLFPVIPSISYQFKF